MRRWTHLLQTRTLEWLLQRRAAVLEAGGALDDVRAVCACAASLQAVLRGLLLWQLARYDTLPVTRHKLRRSNMSDTK